MLNSEEYRKQRNDKRFYKSIERKMRDHGSVEEKLTGISSENVERDASKVQTLTQETVNEQVEEFLAPVTRHLEELTPKIQGIVTPQHSNQSPE